MTRCLFGPAARTFSAQDLGASADAVLFDFDGNQGLRLSHAETWDEILPQPLSGLQPEFLALPLSA